MSVRARQFSTTLFEDKEFAGRITGGLEVHVTERLFALIDASVVFPTGNIAGSNYVRLGWGAGYRF